MFLVGPSCNTARYYNPTFTHLPTNFLCPQVNFGKAAKNRARSAWWQQMKLQASWPRFNWLYLTPPTRIQWMLFQNCNRFNQVLYQSIFNELSYSVMIKNNTVIINKALQYTNHPIMSYWWWHNHDRVTNNQSPSTDQQSITFLYKSPGGTV